MDWLLQDIENHVPMFKPVIIEYKYDRCVFCGKYYEYIDPVTMKRYCTKCSPKQSICRRKIKKCHCGGAAYFGPNNTKVRCINCKVPGDTSKTPAKCPCGRTARYGPGKKLRCSKCKVSGDIDLMYKYCSKCNNRATWKSFMDGSFYCYNHKTVPCLRTAVNLCGICGLQAHYGPRGGKVVSCREHSDPSWERIHPK